MSLLLLSDPFPKGGFVEPGFLPMLVVGGIVTAFVAVSARAAGGRAGLFFALAAGCALLMFASRFILRDWIGSFMIVPGCLVSAVVIEWRLARRATASRMRETIIASVAFMAGSFFPVAVFVGMLFVSMA